MPIIAESGPIPLEITPPEEPIPWTPTPPIETPTPTIETPTPFVPPSAIAQRHRAFITAIDAAPTCFNNTAIVGFTGPEFDLHLQLAKIDKYVADAGNGNYCSKKALNNLSKALDRSVI